MCSATVLISLYPVADKAGNASWVLLKSQLWAAKCFLSYAAEVDMIPGCDTLNASYTVCSLPGGNNEASLSSLVVRYQPILGGGSTRSRNISLNGRAAEGVLSLTGLTRDTAYRVTYRVEIAVSFQVTLPSDIADPIELHTTRTCDPPSDPSQWNTTTLFYVYCVIAKFLVIVSV